MVKQTAETRQNSKINPNTTILIDEKKSKNEKIRIPLKCVLCFRLMDNNPKPRQIQFIVGNCTEEKVNRCYNGDYHQELKQRIIKNKYKIVVKPDKNIEPYQNDFRYIHFCEPDIINASEEKTLKEVSD